MTDPFRRLRARGDVRIAGDADEWVLNWWPRGQVGIPFCGRGWSGPDLTALAAEAEAATRPPSRDVEWAKQARLWDEERRREDRQRALAREAKWREEEAARKAAERAEFEQRRKWSRQREAKRILG